jgi:hypothetical protein
MVVFSPIDAGARAGARGYIQQDGTFELSTERPGDGSLGGRYRVLVKPPTQGRADDEVRNNNALLIDPRHTRFEASGLEFEVKPGPNHCPITVEPPARRWVENRLPSACGVVLARVRWCARSFVLVVQKN